MPIALFFSCFTLWLVQSEIKYPLFVFEASVMIMIYYLLVNEEILDGRSNFIFHTLRKGFKVIAGKFQDSFLGILLVTTSSILTIFNLLHVEGGTIQLSLAFLCTSILSGYALMSIFNITKYFSKLEIAVLSYLLSFIFSGFSTLALLSIDENMRSIAIPILFIIVGTISVILRQRRKGSRFVTITNEKPPISFSKNIDILAISLSIIFYLIFFYYTYPSMALLPNSDISRHYNDSLVLSRTPDLYTGFYYLLFHAFEATFQVLSGIGQPIESFLTIQIILNISLPIAVYILAKRFLENVDKRIPSISIIFYSIFSNFSFIYFAQLKVIGTTSNVATEVQLLGKDVAEKAFNGTINFGQPFPWFVPLSVSFVMFTTALLLLKVHSLPRPIFVSIYAALILAMYLTHVAEAIIFVVFIAIYSFIYRDRTGTNALRLDDALLSGFIGFIIAFAFFGYTSFGWKSEIMSASYRFSDIILSISPLILPILLVGASMVWRKTLMHRIHFKVKYVGSNKFYSLLSVLLVSLYLYGLLTWFFTGDFKTSSILDIGITPWFVYPLVLGVVGLLAIIAIRYLGEILPNRSVAIIVAGLVFMLLMGRLISFVNINFVPTGYWEKRFPSFIFLFACLLAPIPLIKFAQHARLITLMKRKVLYSNTLLITVISLIVLSGFSSMVLQSEYWSVVANSNPYRITEREWQAVNYMRNILRHDAYAITITPTARSHNVLVFASPGYQFSLPDISMLSKYPDVSLLSLSAFNLKHAYIYMDTRDFNTTKEQSQSWLIQHLLQLLPVVFSNSEVKIYNATHVSFPISNSDSTMIIPSDLRMLGDNSWFYAYDVLSQSGKNYTVRLDKDPNALGSKTVVLGFDPVSYYSYYDKFSSSSNATYFNNNQWIVISGNWNYYLDGLHAGNGVGKSNNIQNILLSPVSSNNFTASTSIKIISLKPAIPNYLSIIYSWTDPNNYRFAGITLLDDKHVYMSFSTVNNGKLSVFPTWPGIKTNLMWKPGDNFNLTLALQNHASSSQEQLFLNGTRYLKINDASIGKSGYLGLICSRILNVVFHDFKIQQLSKLDVRPFSDYIAYVKSGGHLVVLNSNGYGDIASSLFTSNTSTNETTKLPLKEVKVVPLTMYTSSQAKSSPITAIEANIGDGMLTYINIRPVISNYVQNNLPGPMVYKTLEKVADLVGLRPINSPTPNLKDVLATFKKMSGSGNIELNTSSIIFPSDTNIDKMTVITSNHKNFTSAVNVTQLNIEGYHYIVLDSVGLSNHNYISLTNGRGLYADLTLGKTNSNTIKLSFSGDKAKITVMGTASPKEKSFHFSNVSNIYILNNQQPIHLYARQPTIDINNGVIAFKELHSEPFYLETAETGHDLRALGNVHLSTFMSDSSTLINDISINNSSRLTTPTQYSYNEMTSLLPQISLSKLQSVPLLVIGLVFIQFLIAIFLLNVNHSTFKLFSSRPRKKDVFSSS